MCSKIASVFVFVLAAAVIMSGCGKKKSDPFMEGAGSTVKSQITEQERPQVVYDELSAAVVNGCLEVNVSTPNMGSVRIVSEKVVLAHPEAKSAMSVLFYEPGQVPGKDVPIHRMDWTRAAGYKQAF